MLFAFISASRRPYRHRARFEGVLGTVLELQLLSDGSHSAREAEAQALAEIDRLEAVYSRYLEGSELNRWQRGEVKELSDDLRWLLLEAERWMEQTGGAFNPAVDAVQTLHKQNPIPSEAQLEPLRAALRAPLWGWEGNRAVKHTALSLNFNSFAKGHIADCAAAAALRLEGVQQVMINLGGDLCHRGKDALEVAIAHPFSRADNAPALARLSIRNQGVATSGHTQRGRHLFDPRTAQPVSGVTQATVVAQNAATADVLATALCVLEPHQGLALADQQGVGALIVDTSGKEWNNKKLEEVKI